MMKLRFIGIFFGMGMLVGVALAANTISRYVVDSGVGRAEAVTHLITGTVGQAAVGLASGDTHKLQAGFWPGTGGGVVGSSHDLPEVPRALALGGIRPNPATEGAWIHFDLPVEGNATVDICTVDGRSVRIVWAGSLGAGKHRVRWDGRDDGGVVLATGVYFCRLRTGGSVLTRKVVVLR